MTVLASLIGLMRRSPSLAFDGDATAGYGGVGVEVSRRPFRSLNHLINPSASAADCGTLFCQLNIDVALDRDTSLYQLPFHDPLLPCSLPSERKIFLADIYEGQTWLLPYGVQGFPLRRQLLNTTQIDQEIQFPQLLHLFFTSTSGCDEYQL